MNISILAAGAGGMYCGSCLRDSAIAHALRNQGHVVTLIPLYTPLKNERDVGTTHEVFYGGVNLYLQHSSPFFRKTPRMLDWVFDRPWLLNLAGKFGAQGDPSQFAGLTMDVLKGEDGAAAKELHRLTEFMRDHVKPEVICLPNLMFVGMAREFRERIGVPVVCELTGEDIFLDAMKSEDREDIRRVIRERAKHVSQFVATSSSYADRMAEYLEIDRSEIDVVYTGLSQEYFAERHTPASVQATNGKRKSQTIGYVGRACPEKGLELLIDAMIRLRGMPNMWNVRLKVAGYVGSRDAKWYAELQKRAAQAGLGDQIEWMGEVSIEKKIQLLDSIDVFTMPTTIAEPKGASVIEAMSRGVPVVQPRHGSFPELIEMTGGGVLIEPNNVQALADALSDLLHDSYRAREMGRRGQAAVAELFTERRMANEMLSLFERTIAEEKVPT